MTARIVVRFSTSLLFVALCAVGCVGHPAPHRLSVVRPGSVVVKLQDDMGLSASPSLLSKNGDQVTVTFSGVTYPTKDDWIGVYAPANASVDFMTISPVKYKFATDDPNYLATGNGSVAFRLINMRSEYVFTFMRGGFKEPWLSAVSNSVAFTDYNVPLQGHLSLTPYPFSLAITWVTRDTATPMVQWGTQSGVYVYSNYADTSTYTQDMMCGSPASDEGWHDPGQIHTALLLNLEPGTRYYYVFGDQDLNGPDYGTQHPAGRGLWSKEFSFTAPPIPGANNGVRIAAYGDMGTAYMDGALETGHGEELPSLNTTANVLSEIDDTDIVFHIGDISYARGYATDWEDFFNQIEPVAASVPYMVGIGNHERDFPDSGSKFVGHDSGGECGVPYNNRFPYAGADGAPGSHVNDTPWYSFDFGNVHAVYMSTEHDFSSGSAQLAFLQNDLASVNRSLTPWVIFTGHRPMYIDSNFDVNPDSDQVVARELRQYVEPLLVDYQVDLALWGHHHSYQRTCMVNQEVCLSDKDRAQGKRLPIHAVIGMAGMGLSQNLESPTPSWIHYVNDQVFGYSRIQTNATHLHFQFVQNTGKTVLDDFVIAL